MKIGVNHLLILPILLPLITGALLLFYDERRSKLKSLISISSTGLLVIIAVLLIIHALKVAPAADVYRLGNWPSPFGIVLVLDRLSSMMLLLSSLLITAALVFAQAHWYKAGPHFQSLMQFFMVGINGAFLTGDLFNLFVFFEVMLTASYGLVLHGSGQLRVRAGLHYVVVNLIASLFFLVGTALIYGIVGTLNMADLAVKMKHIASADIVLFEIGAALLGIAFLLKVGMWPLNFWLMPTYSAAAAPVGASFALLSKVGIYIVLRLTLLWFGPESEYFSHFGKMVLFYGGLATMAFGFIGVLASQVLVRLVAYSILVSSGTLLATIGIGNIALTAGALFYIVSSTLAFGAFFLLVELVERCQDVAANVLTVTMEVYGDDEEEEEDEVGTYLPVTLAILGVCFGICAILIIGLPPFSGFIAKFMMFMAILNHNKEDFAASLPVHYDWLFVIFVTISGFAALIALTRTGIRTFWVSHEGTVPRVQVIEFVPIAVLLTLCVLITIIAGPVSHYMSETAKTLYESRNYIGSVLDDFSLKNREMNQ
ncbi:monovalent cation/H+ antiporter subunit D [Bartonella henselae]|uniref:monovalent cation/H+ antiporter subunit D n=1 Tax=Bartonella henselae TaxID=38323 RepID=UPI000965986D|nr:monovalent cation/H+ antiporter subunit D [Bartonella henselae]OLL53217.1 cation:proton antiporter [Bartonella henselae]OLL55849.1 cation:proton antiporter [Bartonella henselae]UJM32411.1 monovalent cation/H+ antiporter subunit D [Bartonella henselae]